MAKVSPFVQALLSEAAWTTDLFVVDVGASGGISAKWALFGDRLRAVGFEPLLSAVSSLNELEARPKVRYEAAYVGCHDYDSICPPEARQIPLNPFARSSAVRAASSLHREPTPAVQEERAQPLYTDRRVTLDEYFAEEDGARVDFLKVDTDGHDLPVLIGARRLLRSGVLGVKIEVQFQGAAHPGANTFANIDNYLRECGFSLFDLQLFRYSRAAFPAPFASRLIASTVAGQVVSGHALYFRDIAHHDYEQQHPFTVTPERVLKLAALFALFGFADCAAELLVNRYNEPSLLDLLPASVGYPDATYRDVIARFDADPAQFVFAPRDTRERIDELKARNRALKERLARVSRKVD